MPKNYYCPQCGRKLGKSDYGLDYNTVNLHVARCPDCGEIGSVVHDAMQAVEKYVKENIENFDLRYELALDTENQMRCSLEYADNQLYTKIIDRMAEWCEENDEDINEFDVEDIF